MLAKLIQILRIQWGVVHRLLCFIPKTSVLEKFGPKNQKYQFTLKLGRKTTSNMDNSMELLISSVLGKKHILLGRFGQKTQNFQFKPKISMFNPGQNICIKIEKTCKTGQDKKSLISNCARFLTAIAKV